MKSILAAGILLFFTYCDAKRIKCYSCHTLDLGEIGSKFGLNSPTTVFDVLKPLVEYGRAGEEPIIENAFCKDPVDASHIKEADTTKQSCFVAEIRTNKGMKMTVKNGYTKNNCGLIRSLAETTIPRIMLDILKNLQQEWPEINKNITTFLNEMAGAVPEEKLNKIPGFPKRPFKIQDTIPVLTHFLDIFKEMNVMQSHTLVEKLKLDLKAGLMKKLTDLQSATTELPSILKLPTDMEEKINKSLSYISGAKGDGLKTHKLREYLKKIRELYTKINSVWPTLGVGDITKYPLKKFTVRVDCEECSEEKCNKEIKMRTAMPETDKPEKPEKPEDGIKKTTPSLGMRFRYPTYELFLILTMANLIY